MRVQLLWGCDSARQFEVAWVRHLIGPAWAGESAWWRPEDGVPKPIPGAMPVLVESGLLRLERRPAADRLAQQARQRQARVSALQRRGPFGVVHLSDEEGLDADGWYGLLPPSTPIWRNFPHPRLEASPWVRGFPIGPRDLFLAQPPEALQPASQRP